MRPTQAPLLATCLPGQPQTHCETVLEKYFIRANRTKHQKLRQNGWPNRERQNPTKPMSKSTKIIAIGTDTNTYLSTYMLFYIYLLLLFCWMYRIVSKWRCTVSKVLKQIRSSLIETFCKHYLWRTPDVRRTD